MAKDMEAYLQDLQMRRASAAGTEKDAATQPGKNRLTARERLDLLFDPDTFTEIDTLVLPRHENYPGGKSSRLGDGVVTGFGLVNGRAYTLKEVGQKFGLTRERIRQIESLALRRLRHPCRSRQLRDYLS